ncbi:MAG: hypothetical protein QNJ26_18635 [Desulfobacterales bacterium]|nr:hypothetical protein [Desulfobacterales bacterium]
MSFEHSQIRHGVINGVQVIVILIAGVLFYFIDKKFYGRDIGYLFNTGFIVLLLLFAIYLIQKLKRRTEYTQTVTDEMIEFKSNGATTHQFQKDDISKIDIKIRRHPRIKFFMKSGKKVTMPGCYFFNPDSLFKELMLCGYPVVDKQYD